MRVVALAFAIVTALAGTAAAQHGHGSKGPNGGPLEDIAGVHAELITSGNAITINVVDEGSKPVSTKGYCGSVLIVTGAARETVTLAPSGDSALKGEAKAPIAASSVVSLVLKTGAGKSGQVRFKR
jgi:hypothetical protein